VFLKAIIAFTTSRRTTEGNFLAKTPKDTTLTSEHNSYVSYGVSLRKQVCTLLDEDPLLMPKMLAKLLDFTPKEYKKRRQTLTNYRNYWKYNHENERGSKCSSFHCFKAKVRLDGVLSEALRRVVKLDVERGGVGFGWVLSKARNRFLVWKCRLGRVVWFESGTVTLHVRRPGNLGKAKQLFCDAFVNTGLLTDMKLLNPVLERIRPKSGHFPYSSGERLPYMVIRDFELSHGIVIKVGDRTHPDAVEVIAGFSDAIDLALQKLDALEKSDKALQKITGILTELFDVDSDKRVPKGSGGKDYVS
jgi:hypothetical protein